MVDKLVGILKSNGKLGGAGLMLLGLAYTGLIAWGKVGGSIEVSMGIFFAGLGVFGIRNKLDGLPPVTP
jgi:hypothetical protein